MPTTKKKKNERKKQNKSNVREKQKQLNFKSFFFRGATHTYFFYRTLCKQACVFVLFVRQRWLRRLPTSVFFSGIVQKKQQMIIRSSRISVKQ